MHEVDLVWLVSTLTLGSITETILVFGDKVSEDDEHGKAVVWGTISVGPIVGRPISSFEKHVDEVDGHGVFLLLAVI